MRGQRERERDVANVTKLHNGYQSHETFLCNYVICNYSTIIATPLNRQLLSNYLTPFAMVIKFKQIHTYYFRAGFQSEEDTNE